MSETKFTPGPWRWEISLTSKRIVIAGGTPKFDLYVLDFVRWGMNRAAPRFLDHEKSIGGLMLMERAETFAAIVPGREHHKSWFQSIDHPDAHLIAAAPDLYARVAAHAAQCGACGGTGTPDRMSAMDDSRAPDGSCSVCYEDRRAMAKARGENQ